MWNSTRAWGPESVPAVCSVRAISGTPWLATPEGSASVTPTAPSQEYFGGLLVIGTPNSVLL
jgi:hypothetical protein